MPSTATISGIFKDTDGNPVQGGTIVATLVGTDAWEDGTRIVTSEESTTTDADGHWALTLIVNGDGRNAATTWTFAGYYPGVNKVFEVKGIFIPVALPALLNDLEVTSAENIKAAKSNTLRRQFTAPNYESYLAMPAGQRRENDVVYIVSEGA